MTPYFDVSEETHLELIPSILHEAKDLAVMAEIAEAEVINRFTAEVPRDHRLGVVTKSHDGGAKLDDHRFVFLRGFEVDAADVAVGADLKVALRRTISRVIVRMVQTWGKDDRFLSEGNGRNTRTLRPSAASRFPSGWDSLLRPFDTRIQVYTL